MNKNKNNDEYLLKLKKLINCLKNDSFKWACYN